MEKSINIGLISKIALKYFVIIKIRLRDINRIYYHLYITIDHVYRWAYIYSSNLYLKNISDIF